MNFAYEIVLGRTRFIKVKCPCHWIAPGHGSKINAAIRPLIYLCTEFPMIETIVA